MSGKITLSVDAMGGASAPHSVIEAVNNICEKHKDVRFLIFAQKERVESLLKKYESLKNRYELIHCDTAVADDEQPVRAMKTGKESTMRKAIEAVKEGRAQACVSAGNTGALMVMAKMVLGSLSGIKRPAIVGVYPNIKGGTVLLDVGANTECDPIHFYQFAIMGSCFAKAILHKKTPTVGILNIGTEEIKGRDVEKKSHELLKESGLNFYGHIEAHDLAKGTVDVCVTDGFVGNIVVKASEGMAKVCRDFTKEAFTSSFLGKLAGILAKDGLRKAFKKLDPDKVNGAMFIGVNGIVIKSHGSSNATAHTSAIEKAIDAAKQDMNKEIVELIEQSHEKADLSLMGKIKHSLGIK